MRNRDMPAKAITEEETDRVVDGVEIFTGLTKLESAAISAMQGILVNAGRNGIEMQGGLLAAESVNQANALFDELERQSES